MGSADDDGAILVTGACGHIGSVLCRALRSSQHEFLAIDLSPGDKQDVIPCDLTQPHDLARLFQAHRIRAVIHLAGILPSAFQSNPLLGAEVNLGGSVELLRQCVVARVKRFVFASSMSVYGSAATTRPLTEDDPAAPDESYGASKRAVELIGEAIGKSGTVKFVSLRIARVVGRGVKKTSSPWRSQIFESIPRTASIRIPFSPPARLSLVHVDEVTRMLVMLTEKAERTNFVYNTPVEIWEARRLKEMIEQMRDIHVELAPDGIGGGPMCDGQRFAQEFGFQLRGLREYLAECQADSTHC